jgi:hypothetical protein
MDETRMLRREWKGVESNLKGIDWERGAELLGTRSGGV